MKRKKRIDDALRNLAIIQTIFERHFRLNGNRDAEEFAIVVDCMYDVAKALGGHQAEKDLYNIVCIVREETKVKHDKSRDEKDGTGKEEG